MMSSDSSSMSMAETYFLASKARSKLSREAQRNDHNLRVLVSHANMLDNLMGALTKKRAAGIAMEPVATPAKPMYNTHPIAAISEVEEEEEDEDDYEGYSEDDDSSDDDEWEYEEIKTAPLNTHVHEIQVTEISDSDEEDDDDEDELENDDGSVYHVSSVSESAPSLSYSSEEESEDDLHHATTTTTTTTTHVQVVGAARNCECNHVSVSPTYPRRVATLNETSEIVDCIA